MGIVKENSISLVDFTNQKRALHSQRSFAGLPIRLRPIQSYAVGGVEK